MKATVCLLLVALGCALAQPSPSPSRNATAVAAASASPSPAVKSAKTPLVEASPLVEGVMVEPSPSPEEVAEAASPSPAAETAVPELESPEPAMAAMPGMPAAPVANTTGNATAANITDNRVSEYYSSPLFAIQQTPELSGLAGLVKESKVAPKLLNNKTLVGTIFAPNNDAVKAAVEFLSNATSVDPAALGELGVIDQLLTYHVTPGAALLLSRLTDGQKLTMLDGNKTTISIEGAAGARHLLQEKAYFINSDSNQQAKVSDGNIQGGKAMIHIIDAVLVPEALLEAFNVSSEGLPGAVPGQTGAATTDATAATASKDVTAPAAPPAKSSATKAVAAFLALPALLAALMI